MPPPTRRSTAPEDTLENVYWVEVEEFGVELKGAADREYQAEVEVAFELEG